MATRNDEYDGRSFDETRTSSTSTVESPVLVRAHSHGTYTCKKGLSCLSREPTAVLTSSTSEAQASWGLDTAGPFKPAYDQGGFLSRYFLVGTLTWAVPVEINVQGEEEDQERDDEGDSWPMIEEEKEKKDGVHHSAK